MTQSAVKTACCSLLLLASIIQGLQDVPVLVGQNASLPCFIKNVSDIVIVNVEWTKKDKKLVLFTPTHGYFHFVPNVTLKTIYNGTDRLIGTYVELFNVNKGDAGTYICDTTTYPNGAIRSKTELTVKDKIECDMNSTIEVNSGENVTIHCSEFSKVTYTWSKGEVFVSDSASLQLLSVSGASSGLYTLKADTGNSRLEATFTIKVFTQTTDYWADATSLSPSYTSNSGGSEATSHSPLSTFATDNAPNSTTTIPTSYRQSTKSQNTPVSSTTYTTGLTVQSEDREGFNRSETDHTTQHYNQSEGFDTDTSNYNHSGTTTIPSAHDVSAEYAGTIDTASASKPPDDMLSKTSTSNIPQRTATVNTGATLTFRSTTDVPVQQDPSDSEGQSHLALTLCIIIGGLLLIVVALMLYRRRVVKKRMDLPPPFKPPPPPVKYVAVRNPQQQFPTDRCNSVTIGVIAERRQMIV